MSSCAQKSGGFLGFFSSACGDPAVAVCIRCGKPVCAQHQQVIASGISCPDCVTAGSGLMPNIHTGSLHSHHHDGDSTSYSSSDYDTFTGKGGEMDGGGASGDFQDS